MKWHRFNMNVYFPFIDNPTDAELLYLYRIWSEAVYSAGFIDPAPETVAEFRRAISDLKLVDLDDDAPTPVEHRMLEEFHKQQTATSVAPPVLK